MVTFENGGMIKTDKRSADDMSWDTQTEWSDNQEQINTQIDTGTVKLSERPDTSMFSSPVYHFWAGRLYGTVENYSKSPDFPEVLAGLTDPSTTDETVFHESREGKPAIKFFNGVKNYSWTADNQLPTGDSSHSWAVMVRQLSTTESGIVSYGPGNSSPSELTGMMIRSSMEFILWGQGLTGNTSVSNDQWITGGGVYDSSGDTMEVYLNGSQDGSQSTGAVDLKDQNHRLGTVKDDSFNHKGYIAEVILCDTAETSTAMSDYHSDRLG